MSDTSNPINTLAAMQIQDTHLLVTQLSVAKTYAEKLQKLMGCTKVDDPAILQAANKVIPELHDALMYITGVRDRTNKLLEAHQSVGTDQDGVDRIAMIRIVIAATAEHYGLLRDALQGPSNTEELRRPRQIAMYVCQTMIDGPLDQVTTLFGRDDAAVMHAERHVKKLVDEDEEVARAVTAIIETVNRKIGHHE